MVIRVHTQARADVGALFRCHHESITAQLRRSVPADDVLDLVQETFRRAVENAHRLDPDRAGAWLNAVARNVAADYHRRRGRQPDRASTDRYTEPVIDLDMPHQVADRALVADALSGLPPSQRQIAYLCSGLGYTVPQAAAALGISPTAAKSRLTRTIERLRH